MVLNGGTSIHFSSHRVRFVISKTVLERRRWSLVLEHQRDQLDQPFQSHQLCLVVQKGQMVQRDQHGQGHQGNQAHRVYLQVRLGQKGQQVQRGLGHQGIRRVLVCLEDLEVRDLREHQGHQDRQENHPYQFFLVRL